MVRGESAPGAFLPPSTGEGREAGGREGRGRGEGREEGGRETPPAHHQVAPSSDNKLNLKKKENGKTSPSCRPRSASEGAGQGGWAAPKTPGVPTAVLPCRRAQTRGEPGPVFLAGQEMCWRLVGLPAGDPWGGRCPWGAAAFGDQAPPRGAQHWLLPQQPAPHSHPILLPLPALRMWADPCPPRPRTGICMEGRGLSPAPSILPATSRPC